jgi:hypothetical protein
VDTCDGRAAGLGSPNIDGLFLDDGWGSGGPSEVESHSVADMGLSPSQLRDIRGNWTAKMGKPASEDEWGWPIRTHPHSQA